MMKNLVLLTAFVAPLAAQAPVTSTNLGGGCLPWGSSSVAWTSPASGRLEGDLTYFPPQPTPGVGSGYLYWLFIGVNDPTLPLPGCGCVIHVEPIFSVAAFAGPSAAISGHIGGFTTPPGVSGFAVKAQAAVTVWASASYWPAVWFAPYPGFCSTGVPSLAMTDGYTVVLP